jgi:hypothetical protein
MGEAMYDQQKILKLLNMGGETMERFFHKNAEYLLNL